MATTTVEITDPEGSSKKTTISVPGQSIYLSKGIEHYELGDTGVDIYGNAGEKVKIETDKIVVYYDRKDETGSQIVFPVQPSVNAETLVGRLDELSIPEGEEGDPTRPDGGRRKKTRMRKTKRRRTLRKHK